MKIRIVNPIVAAPAEGSVFGRWRRDARKRELLSRLAPDCEIDYVGVEHGAASIESRYDQARALPELMRLVSEAETAGVDACIINAVAEPGLRVCRELVRIPVVGPCESSLLIASALCDRVTVLSVLASTAELYEENRRAYGLTGKQVTFRPLGVPVLELYEDEAATREILLRASAAALAEDRAQAVILGTTGIIGFADEIAAALDVPVIEPLPAALRFAAMLVALGLRHSKVAFPFPAEKYRT